MSILLDVDEILGAASCVAMGGKVLATLRQSNKAQAKKIYEWGNGVCSHGTSIDGFGFIMTPRRGCQECWQELMEEVK